MKTIPTTDFFVECLVIRSEDARVVSKQVCALSPDLPGAGVTKGKSFHCLRSVGWNGKRAWCNDPQTPRKWVK